ncbi:hypothetical protein CDO44_10535 [Pigmentiphaga sp. NML080357]|uniref:DUF4936 family protein n=1 Tax=Pigmentiphaga sp. NML080357 TaxID=2008675 RepID=UPI000B4125E0|nr:DUF4936 family protein [Pigmentiphaga sp. NML080357]OVZ59993.1 hypothetical protein CDO44_10535 [Pigmentiphaga sp. NML080357]
MNHLYVYYKLRDAQRPQALAPARRVLEAGRAWSRRVALLARPASEGGVATWMEVYEGVEDMAGLEAALAAAVDKSGLAGFLLAPRRSEIFAELPADAAALDG